jgi:hypothetical protein
LGSSFNTSKPFALFDHQIASISNGILTVSYPAGSAAPSVGALFGGAQICLPFTGGPERDATLSYDIRIPTGFSWVKGGKLPGLYGGVEPFSGGKHNAAGWSMRLMWRKNGVGEVYAYISTTNAYGDDLGRAAASMHWSADGEWHRVTEHVVLNTPGQVNGSVSLALDGTVYIVQSGLAVTTDDTRIGGLFFSTFFGGNDRSWAVKSTQHIDFRNFTVV